MCLLARWIYFNGKPGNMLERGFSKRTLFSLYWEQTQIRFCRVMF